MKRKTVRQFKTFIESICKAYGKEEAIKPLQEGFDAMLDVQLESASSASKRKWINKMYQVAEPLIRGLFQDDNWSHVHDAINALKTSLPELNLEFNVIDGGYSCPGEDNMPRRKTWQVRGTTPEGFPIVGQLHCDAAGTMDNPFGAYDMTLTLN